MRVRIQGERFLPPWTDAQRMTAAVERVAGLLGIAGEIQIDVRPWRSKTLGKVDDGVIVLYHRTFYKRRIDPRWRTPERLWAWTIAHELVHLSQHKRGAVLPGDFAEPEAEALEPIYGPIIEDMQG